jgi:hypothetical protein
MEKNGLIPGVGGGTGLADNMGRKRKFGSFFGSAVSFIAVAVVVALVIFGPAGNNFSSYFNGLLEFPIKPKFGSEVLMATVVAVAVTVAIAVVVGIGL